VGCIEVVHVVHNQQTESKFRALYLNNVSVKLFYISMLESFLW